MTILRTGIHGHSGPGVIPVTAMVSGALGGPKWWDPNNEGLPVVGAYRAIASVGSPWPLAPANYADTLQDWSGNQPNLVEGLGAVPWAAATGWGFVAAATQYFDTGIVPTLNQTWSALVQYSAFTSGPTLWGVYDTGGGDSGSFAIQWVAGNTRSYHGAQATFGNNVAPPLAGNLAIAALQPYRNGIADPNPIVGAVGTTDLSIYIGCLHANLVAGQHSTVNIESFAIYSGTLTAPQVLVVETAMGQL